MSDLDLFPQNYLDARSRFLGLVRKLSGAKCTDAWSVPSKGEVIFTVDTVYLPPTAKPKTLFVMISGVHGLEAYAGHAVQAMTMNELIPLTNRSHTGFFFIHALNPYGFHHHTRGTEIGVNLNRNCSARPSLYDLKNPESLRLSDRFVPKAPVENERSFLLRQMRQEKDKIFFDDVSLDAFIKGVGLGQFESAEGLEFGGFEPEPQIVKMTEALRQIMPDYEDIVLFDLHTGLGERARLHLLTGDVPGCVHPQLFSELFQPSMDREVYDFTPADSEGFYETYGATNNIFPELALNHQRVCAMTMEFGTLGHDVNSQMESLNQWLLEHQGSLYGYATPQLAEKVRADYLEKFFPRDPAWRLKILATSREFLTRVLGRTKILAVD
jgi:hypothetical protein